MVTLSKIWITVVISEPEYVKYIRDIVAEIKPCCIEGFNIRVLGLSRCGSVSVRPNVVEQRDTYHDGYLVLQRY